MQDVVEGMQSLEDQRDWNDSEIEVFIRRQKALVDDGATSVESVRLARIMLLRDRPDSGDDRRICLECKGLKKHRCLTLNIEPVRRVLMRCDGFVARGSK